MVVSGLEDSDNIREGREENQPERWRWGNLRKFEIPTAIVKHGRLTLNPPALATLLVLAESARAARRRRSHLEPLAEVRMGHRLLAERSGYSKDRITAGLKELEEHGFIKRMTNRRDRGIFGANSYLMCDPSTAQPLEPTRPLIYLECPRTVSYLTLPASVVKDATTDWCLARMSSSEVRLYLALCWLANTNRTGQYPATASELKRIGNFSTIDTMEKALDGLECKGLVDVQRDGTHNCTIQLLDPRTGDPPHVATGDPRDDPSNYRATGPRGGDRPMNLNAWTPERRRKVLLDSLQPGAPVRDRPEGVVMICCPFHADDNPSCSVDTRGGGFNCFACGEHGRFRKLIDRLRGISGAESIELMGQELGQELNFREPDSNAEAIYAYRYASGDVAKEVLRFHPRRFVQRCPDRRRRVRDIGPMLYNLDRLQNAQVVCICEGEKDCETFDSLSLHSALGGDVVPTTSGSADSWHDELADTLRGKRVILMPDDDVPGARYAASIRTSLDQRCIEYRTVSFHEDVDVKDLSDFMEAGHTKEELVERIGRDWVAVVAPSPFDAPAEFAPA